MTTYTAADVNSWYNAIQYQDGVTATVNAFVTQLNNGNITEDSVITAIINENYTQQYVNPIVDLYQASFNSTPDANGAAYWTSLFASGTYTFQQIASFFASSSEFQSIYGNATGSEPINVATLNLLYNNTLNINVPASAVAQYVNQVPPLTIDVVLATLALDPAFVSGAQDAVTAFQYGQAYGNSSPNSQSGSLFEWAEFTPANTIYIGAPGVYTVSGGNTEIIATQDTFTANTIINGNHTFGNELKLIDTGDANWTVPHATVRDIQEVELTNHSTGTPTTSTITVSAVTGSSISVDGLTVSFGGAATTADVIYSLATGLDSTDGQATVSGAYINYHVTSNNPATNSVTYTANSSGPDAGPNVSYYDAIYFSQVTDYGTGQHTDTVDASFFKNATSFSADNSTGDVILTHLVSGQEIEIEGDKGQTNNGDVTAIWDSGTIANITVADGVNHVVDAPTGADITIYGETLKTVNLTSNTYDNELGNLNLDLNVTTLNIRANTDLEIQEITGDTLKSVYISGDAQLEPPDPGQLYGEPSVEIGALATTVQTLDASQMTRGGVDVSLPTSVTKFIGGQGSDNVGVYSALSSKATVNGNGGFDELVLADNVVNNAQQGAQYSNFEVVENIGAGGINFSYLNPTNTVEAVRLNNITASAYGMTALTAASIDFETTSTNAGLSLANDIGATDVFNITVGGQDGAVVNVQDLRMSYVETVNFYNNNNDSVNNLTFAQDNTGLEYLNLTGNYGIFVDFATTGSTGDVSQVDTLLKVDASGLTVFPDESGLTLGDGLGGHQLTATFSVTGSAADDSFSFIGSSYVSNVPVNADTLSKGSGVNMINGGAGNDALLATLDQLFTTGHNSLGFDGGTGVNTLLIDNGTITNFSSPVSDTIFEHVSNVQNLDFYNDGNTGLSFQSGINFAKAYATGVYMTTGESGAQASTIDLSLYTQDATVVEINKASGIQTAIGGSGNDTITIGGNGYTAGSVVVKGGAGNDTIIAYNYVTDLANYVVQVTGGAGQDYVDQSAVFDLSPITAYSVVEDIYASGDSAVGTPDNILGYNVYDGVALRYSDTLNLNGALVSNTGVALTTVSGFTSQQLQYHVNSVGVLLFSGTLSGSSDVNTALVENVVWTQLKAQLSDHYTVVWNDLNNADVNNGNSLVFSKSATSPSVMTDSEIVLVGTAATVTGIGTNNAANHILVA